MDQIESQSYRTSHRLRNFFMPSGAAAALYVVIGVILLVVLNSGSLVRWLGGGYIGPAHNLNASLGMLSDGFSSSFSPALGGRLGQIILWSFLGAATYVGLWFLRNLLNSFENDAIVNHYTHPRNFNRLGYWESAVAGKIFFLVVAIIFVAYVYFSIRLILPATAAMAGRAMDDFHPLTSPLYILVGLVISILLVYIASLLVRTIARLWSLL